MPKEKAKKKGMVERLVDIFVGTQKEPQKDTGSVNALDEAEIEALVRSRRGK